MIRCINCATPIESCLYCPDCFSILGVPQPQPAVEPPKWPPMETIQEAPEPEPEPKKRLAFEVAPKSYPLSMKFKRTPYGYSGSLLGQPNETHSIYRRRK